MRGLRVKKFKFVILLLFLTSHNSFAVGAIDFCFKEPTHFKCVDQKNGNFSLEGHFKLDSILYSVSARMAYGQDWCEDALKKIKQVMLKNRFCIEGEILNKSSRHLTVNQVYNSKDRWTYFINPPNKEHIYENIY